MQDEVVENSCGLQIKIEDNKSSTERILDDILYSKIRTEIPKKSKKGVYLA